jgi:hypothetical protein
MALGLIYHGIPRDLIGELARVFDIRDFVETGTYHGGSAVWASKRFQKVRTIEIDEAAYRVAQRRLADRKNVEQYLGESAQVLGSLVPRLDGPALFWLDAHWSGGKTGGALHPCPLVDEIAAIDASPLEHVIVVDDMRLCLNAKPSSGAGEWPEIGTLAKVLRARHPKAYLAIHNDVAIRLPGSWAEKFEDIMVRLYQPRSLSRRLKDALALGPR